MVEYLRDNLIKFDYNNWDKLNIIMLNNKKNIWKYMKVAPNNKCKDEKIVVVRVTDKNLFHIMKSNNISYEKVYKQ